MPAIAFDGEKSGMVYAIHGADNHVSMVQQYGQVMPRTLRHVPVDQQLTARSLHCAAIFRVQSGAASYTQNAAPPDTGSLARAVSFFTGNGRRGMLKRKRRRRNGFPDQWKPIHFGDFPLDMVFGIDSIGWE